MRKLLKIIVMVIVVSIFTFSENSTVMSVRTFSYEKGKILYDIGNEKVQVLCRLAIEKGKEIVENQKSKSNG